MRPSKLFASTDSSSRAVEERFACSSHAQKWLFPSRTDLHRAYDDANRRVGLALTPEETAACATVWSSKAWHCAQELGRSPSVCATAALFVQRFYTRVAFTDRKPNWVAPACVLLAVKAQEGFTYDMPLARIVDKLSADARMQDGELAAEEALVLQALDYDLLAYLPVDAIDRFTEDFMECAQLAKPARDALQQAAIAVLKPAFWSTATLLYTPAQLAAAVLGAAVKHMSTIAPDYAAVPGLYKEWLASLVDHQANAERATAAVAAAQDELERALRTEKEREALYKQACKKCFQYKKQQKEMLQQQQQHQHQQRQVA